MPTFKKSNRIRNKTQKRRLNNGIDYNSNDGIMTSIFGPATWHLLHSISFNYPANPSELEKEKYKEFVLSLQNVLPCGKCRLNLKKNFKKCPLNESSLKSRDSFSRYIYNLHETVNTMLNKKSGLTYNDVRDMYESFRARCSSSGGGKGNTKKDEKGCVIPFNGVKKKCVLRVVPMTDKCKSFTV